MKKGYFLTILSAAMLTMTGCTVNWFDRQYDVPWYYIAIPVAVIFVVAHICIMSQTYICPNCKTEFKPRWYHFFTYVHVNRERIAKCPHCQRIGFCRRK